MLVPTTTCSDVTPEQLAQALLQAPPAEFAAVWAAFTDKLMQQHAEGMPVLDGFAQEMAKTTGPTRGYSSLRTLARLVDYHLEVRQRERAAQRPPGA